MSEIVFIILSVFIVSLISFVGVFTLTVKKELIDKIILALVAFGAGTLLGGALFDLIPEAVEAGQDAAYPYIVGGIIIFFVLERLMHWHHHHHVLQEEHHTHSHAKIKPFAYLNLVGDAIHNFIDGIIIAASYLADIHIGIVATIAIIFHEIPQELGEVGILLHGGFTRKKILFLNFVVALTAVAGGLLMFYASSIVPNITFIMLSIASGGFLYIALSNLIPELQHESDPKKILLHTVLLLLGILLLLAIGNIFPEPG